MKRKPLLIVLVIALTIALCGCTKKDQVAEEDYWYPDDYARQNVTVKMKLVHKSDKSRETGNSIEYPVMLYGRAENNGEMPLSNVCVDWEFEFGGRTERGTYDVGYLDANETFDLDYTRVTSISASKYTGGTYKYRVKLNRVIFDASETEAG